MNRIQVLGLSLIGLLVLNVLAWGSYVANETARSPVEGAGCSKLGGRPASAEQMALALQAEQFRPLGPTVAPCTGCTIIQSATQMFCKIRPPNVECFLGPGFDNFNWERNHRIYQCPNNKRGVCCGNWTQHGCCNNSEDEPPCTDETADFNCIEAPSCP